MKTIKAKLVFIVIILNVVSGAVIMAGMNMAYQRNVQLLTKAFGDSAGGMQQQLFADMAGNRNRAMLTALVLTALMAVVLLVALNQLVLKRLDKVIGDATRFVGGDFNTPITVTKQDEIGELEGDLEEFRVLMLDTMAHPQA